MQRHPAKRQVLHMDFLRVSDKETIRMQIPLHFIGEEAAPGVKHGGNVSHLTTDVEVICLPTDLPEYLEVDVSGLDVGDSLHLSDITLPKGVELVDLTHGEGHDTAIVGIHMSRGALEDEEEEESTEAEPEGGE